MLRQLREDANSVELHRLAQEDPTLGRMSVPVAVESSEAVAGVLLNPRFGVEQIKGDGTVKVQRASDMLLQGCSHTACQVRAVDHLSWSPGSRLAEAGGEEPPTKKDGPCKLEGLVTIALAQKARKAASVNGHTSAAEKLRHDKLDALALLMKKFASEMGCLPGLMKACASAHSQVAAAWRSLLEG